MKRNATADTPRVYIACLACYNAGHLVGEWVDATDAEGFDISTLEHAPDVCPHEESAIHDYEGFGGIKLGEYENRAHVARIAGWLEEHGEAFGLWYENETRDPDDDLGREFEEAYRGAYSTLGDYAQETSEGMERVPEWLQFYIDWDKMGEDWERGGDIWTAEGGEGIHVFDNH